MSDPVPSKYASYRDALAAVRELIIVIALLALLFTPQMVRQVLDEAGIRSFAGVEFNEKTLDEVEAAGTRVVELEQQLTMAQQQLSAMAQSSSIRADPRFGSVSRILADAQKKAAETEDNLREARDEQIDLRKRSGKAPRDRVSMRPTPQTSPSSLSFQPASADPPVALSNPAGSHRAPSGSLTTPSELFQR